MDSRLGRLAEYTLLSMTEGTLTDAVVYEFVEECCKCMTEETVAEWTDGMEELWGYLTVGRTAWDEGKTDAKDAFRQGRIYTALECLKINMEKWQAGYEIEKDAKKYMQHWYNVFWALEAGRSLSHKELADACGLSESSLSQFLHKIEHKNYIHFRKAGRNKYYRLSRRGQELLKYMNAEQNYYPCSVSSAFWPALRQENVFKMAPKIHFTSEVNNCVINENCYSNSVFLKKYSYKLREEPKENRYESFVVKC